MSSPIPSLLPCASVLEGRTVETRWLQFTAGIPQAPPRPPGSPPLPTNNLPPGVPNFPPPPGGGAAGGPGGPDGDFPAPPPLPTLPTIPGLDGMVESWLMSDQTWEQVCVSSPASLCIWCFFLLSLHIGYPCLLCARVLMLTAHELHEDSSTGCPGPAVRGWSTTRCPSLLTKESI